MRRLLFVSLAAPALFAVPASAGKPSPKVLAWQFAEAVKTGGDPTLAGAIPVNADQAAKLTELSGCRFSRASISTPLRSVFTWDCPGDDYVTDVFFRDGRAVAIDIAPLVRRRG